MRKNAMMLLCAGMLLLPGASFAEGTADLSLSLQMAREKLLTLLGTRQKETQSLLIADIHKASDAVDQQIEALLAEEKVTREVKQRLTEFRSLWAAFKSTREEEIIPRVLSGDRAKLKEAKEIAYNVQLARYKKMQLLLQ